MKLEDIDLNLLVVFNQLLTERKRLQAWPTTWAWASPR